MMKKMFCGTLGLIFSLQLTAVSVILPENPSVFEKKAAEELVLHLKKTVGKPISVTSENNKPALITRIYVGKTSFAREKGIDFKNFESEEWCIKAVDSDNLIVGGGTPRGVIYGAWELLERVYGVMWLDEEFTYVPKNRHVWSTDLNLKGKPAFAVRGLYAYFKDNPQERWLYQARNRQNLFHDEPRIAFLNDYGISRVFGSPRACHTYFDYTRDWGEKEEECFSLDHAGKRVRATSASGPGQICLSNPKTVKLFAAKLRKFIQNDHAMGKESPMIYDVSANDNDAQCQCSGCLALVKKYQSYGGAVLYFTNQLASELEKDFPDIQIQMFAYMNAAKVPRQIKAHKNVLVRIAQLGGEWIGIGTRDTLRPLSHPNNAELRKNIEDWSRIANVSIWDYWIMYRGTPGMAVCHEAIPENLRFYHSLGIRNIFVEVESPLLTPFYALRQWLGYRYMNNPDLTLEAETERFLLAYYGPETAPVMAELLQYMIDRNREIKAPLNTVPLSRRTDLDAAFFIRTGKLIERALAAVKNDLQEKHIRKERFVLNYENIRKNGSGTLDSKTISLQLQEDFALLAPNWLAPAEQKKFKITLFNRIEGVAAKIPPPKGFENKEIVHDLAWPQLTPHYQSKMVEMPDAAGGRAIQILEKEKTYDKLQFGYYNSATKSQVPIRTIPRNQIPQDEKFHFYQLGKITLGEHGYIWVHPSWTIQRSMDEFYNPMSLNLNEYEGYISIKAEGPSYVTGSKKTNSVSVDRIILVRPAGIHAY